MRFVCRRLGKSFAGRRGAVQALHEVSLEAGGHQFVSLVGPSGCGKTTLLKLLAGLQEPTSGELQLSDLPENGRPPSALVFQDHGLFPWMTVLANVAFGLEMGGMPASDARERASSFIQRVGLAPFADSYPHQLSSGMQQRVGIIRAFACDPAMLLMDEPFGALDAQTRRVLQEELLRLWGERRSLVVFVTHDVAEAVYLSDRIVVLSGRPGTVREQIEVPLSRPRRAEHLDSPELLEIRTHVWRLLEDEVRASLGVQA